MISLTVIVFAACMAFSSAVLGGTGAASGLGLNPASLGGPLDTLGNPTTTSTTNTGTSGAFTSGGNSVFNQLFRNPLMSYGLMGGDNLNRAVMMPALAGLGGSNAANYFFLRGGMDKYFKVRLADMIGQMMVKSFGMNPMLSTMFASHAADVPDHYMLNSMLFNGLNLAGGQTGGEGQSQGSGLMPNGAVFPFQQMGSSVFGMNPMALAAMSMGM